eukprot:CAMPEP_0194159262 /NCGR_PEP_ID=MMETSP0152-20130528/77729_1 /TAXON_ID=1049557 /ORGANISM="Thalassiothrix antarctica, Strain L6-D1" /LENGTH=797 /DNA_ID=CAMNT_0038868805 /DNA_START=962 /DNA_END=3355 /DNA_ORIENTATION=-
MVPKPEESTNLSTDAIELSECEKLYGPYPSAIPVPQIDKDSRLAPSDKVQEAKSMFDLSDYPDYRDKGTPDEWVPRDGKLVRLTGRHPFNVEPPLSVHKANPFITPSCLHYVRNHGACPKLDWKTHTISIGGVSTPAPYEIGMEQLAAMEPRELPVTLVCAGNRRKEQNMIRQTIGFNSGPSGCSTNVWKGVLLRDLLLKAGISERDMTDKHVEFIGIEDLPNKVGTGPFPQEPWGKHVKYGTSVPLARAMNPAYDILIAYEQNGEELQPDHGFPVRLIIPGYIGGRMIKWLKEINVIPHMTRNHYHYHDNRILPPHITAEESLTGKWWYKPDHIFNELNINSVICAPDHNETISIAKNIGKNYNVQGYAYTGGGRKITRIEISIDGGNSWELADIVQREKPTDYNMHWCWISYSYELKVANLVVAKEIWCRAWDESHNTQPTEPTWNLMGMGNNQVFRIKVYADVTSDGEHVFRFEHPTQPGQQKGGWMTTAAGKPSAAGFGKLLQVQGGEAVPKAPAPKPKEIEVSDPVDKNGRKLALTLKRKTTLKLKNKIVLSRDSYLLDLALPTPQHVLGLPTGQHMFLYGEVEGKTIQRAYTPISSNYDVGEVKFVIKAYPPCERFPKGGKMSQYLDTLKIGDSLEVRGPVGEFEYIKNGHFMMDEEECFAKSYNMVAGGTGITPCMQVAAEILRNKDDTTRISVIFACRIEGDLLMRSTLDEWAAEYPKKFKIHYILSDAWPKDWKYSTGFVDKALFEEVFYPASDDCYTVMCGPPIMIKRGCDPALEALGHKESHRFSF